MVFVSEACRQLGRKTEVVYGVGAVMEDFRANLRLCCDAVLNTGWFLADPAATPRAPIHMATVLQKAL